MGWLTDVLEWLGEDVGPAPGEEIHALQVADRVYMGLHVPIRL